MLPEWGTGNNHSRTTVNGSLGASGQQYKKFEMVGKTIPSRNYAINVYTAISLNVVGSKFQAYTTRPKVSMGI